MWERPASLFVGVRKCDEDTLEVQAKKKKNEKKK